MQKIVPHLWFDKEAKEAANFYTSIFPNSKITSTTVLRSTPSGDTDLVAFDLMGYSFLSISAGPYFKLNPSVSFMVNFDPSQDKDAASKLETIWAKLMEGGKALMPKDKYPFSEQYGWVQDKYGVSWQLILTNPTGEPRPLIIPSIMFVGDVTGKAQEATDFYISVFKNSKRGTLAEYPPGASPDPEAKVMFTDFQLEGQWFAAMDSGHMHDFKFSEAISLIINCEDQKEIDYYWEKLSADPSSEQCGWLKDKYGLSWQVTPKELQQYLNSGTPEQIDRVTQAFLPMKKFDVAALKRAYEGK